MSSDLKSVKCLEWCTKLPGLDCQVQSPVFLLKRSECFFRLTLEKNGSGYWYFNLYVELKKIDLNWKSCDINVQIGFKKDMELSLGQKTFTLSRQGKHAVWSRDMNDLQARMRSDYCMKFRFCFKDVDELLMIDRKEMDDKYVQTSALLNADVPVTSLIKDLTKLLDTGENHDAEIKCGEYTIKVHKVIMSARSEVFKAMLQSDMLEGRSGVIEIQDMDVTYVQDFVRYLYTEKMPELNFEKAKALYRAGDKYAVRSLMLQCSEYFQDNLSPENAFECLALTDAHSDEKLIDSIITFCLERKMYLEDDFWSPFCEKYSKIVVKAYRLLHKADTDRKGI